MYFISVIKAEFSASLLQSSVSHDPSEKLLKTVLLLHIFVETVVIFFFF